jgi:ubiquinol-cytochrome c reductase cytochrome c subunit
MVRFVTQVAVVVVVLVATVAGPAGAQSEDEGRELYDQHCAACHQPGGTGLPGAFPPLAGNPSVTDSEYVRDVISNGLSGPITVLGETYDAEMPPVTALDATQIDAVIAYVQSLGGETTTTTAPTGPVGGDAAHGEALFAGSARLENGGPACFSCHEAGTYSQSGAGLGPDLTGAFAQLGGEAGLAGWLANPPSQTMQPIFADKPLTETEIADLTAFLASAEAEAGGPASAGGFDWTLAGGVLGLGLLLALMAFVIRGPRPAYSDRLRSRA